MSRAADSNAGIGQTRSSTDRFYRWELQNVITDIKIKGRRAIKTKMHGSTTKTTTEIAEQTR